MESTRNQTKGRVTCPKCHGEFVYNPTISGFIEDLTYLTLELSRPETKELQILGVGRPEIVELQIGFVFPGIAGKSYGKRQRELEFSKDEDGRCIHGFQKKSWCAICQKRDKPSLSPSVSPHIDLFDLILPILQPPLGDKFDNPIAFPPGKELFPFQRLGVRFLVDSQSALLGDEMGLGKSIQSIVALRFLFHLGKISNVLILCPKTVLTDWEKKLWDWAPELRVIRISGQPDQRQVSWNSPAHIYLTTYETLREDLAGALGRNGAGSASGILATDVADRAKKDFDLAILDEIQKIRNPSSAISKATRRVKSNVRWGLSGTPLENRLEELISVFGFLKPGLLQEADAAKIFRVKEKIEPYFLRRRKADVVPDLPEKVYDEIWLELLPDQRKAYDKAEKEGIVELDEKGDSVTVQHVLALISKLKQICNIDPVSKEGCKLEHLEAKLDEICEQEDKALVFSQYPEKTLRLLEPKLEEFSPLFLHGSLSVDQRNRIVERFQNEDTNKVLLVSVKTGGLGITLTRANYVYHYDLWWNPATAKQAEDRTHRIGQQKTVFVSYLLTADTIEERIWNLLKTKQELFNEVIDDLSDTDLSGILTEDELFALFDLRRVKPVRATGTQTGWSPPGPLNGLSPQEFERLIAALYERMGYSVKVTPPTRDQGVDIFAKWISEGGTENLAIQCKHYPNGIVGVEHVRSLYGVIQAQPSITKGILISSGKFSKDCKDFAEGKRIELFGGQYIQTLMKKYGESI
jgi:superfamily II DNA or RNA helicase